MTGTWNIVVEAASMAATRHCGQARKDGTPYFQHPARVAALLARAGADDLLLAAGYLHDVIEDTPADHDDISAAFGEDVADWVAVMSKDHRLPEPVREPAYKRQLQEGPWQGRAIKLADLLDNLTATIAGQKRLGQRRLQAAQWALDITEDDDSSVITSLRTMLECLLADALADSRT